MSGWMNEWWVWMAIALVLAVVEVLVPAWVSLGFAMGAFFMGAMLALGIGGFSTAWSLVIFAVLSLVSYLVLRQIFGIRRGQVKIWDRDINE